jgi:diguanylate cyclase (GGDEF)-like protein/PAS domain S-box-containing protein
VTREDETTGAVRTERGFVAALLRAVGVRPQILTRPAPGPAFRALAGSTAAAVLIVQDDLIRFANPASRIVTGHDVEELLSTRYSDLFQTELRETMRIRSNPSISQPVPRQEARIVAAGGRERWVDLTATTIEWERRPAILAVAFDITDRKLAEGALRESDRRMRDILENVQLIAVLRDVRGEVTFVNEFFLELVGAPEEEVVGSNWFDTFIPIDERESERHAFLERIRVGIVVPHEESEVFTRHEERRLISWNNTLLHDLDGNVIGAASIGADVTERRRVEQQLVHDALHDVLTGLPNRALFLDRVSGALARIRRRPGHLVAVLFLDVDRFKLLNDSLGHAAGDEFLVKMGRLLQTAVRPGDTVARLGGDEFTLLLEDLADGSDATRIAERIQEALKEPFQLGGHEVFATVSTGIALSTRSYTRGEDLLRDADTAMYQAKADGKARYQIFDTSMHNRAMQLLALESELRRAVDAHRFRLHYQTIVDLETGAIVGLEALARWEHSERGLVSPVEFVSLAEETGLIFGIGEWSLRQACSDMQGWLDRWPLDLYLNVNMSAKQFSQPNLVDLVAAILSESGLDPRRLKLEITESAIMHDAESAIAMLGRLTQLGARVCIDDFGTGYSSLSYLLRFPADTLKIDRSFVSTLGSGQRNAQIVGTIVSLGASLGMDVVAEGVETEIQRRQLQAVGCRFAQGFLFSRPMDPEATAVVLEAEASRRQSLGETP